MLLSCQSPCVTQELILIHSRPQLDDTRLQELLQNTDLSACSTSKQQACKILNAAAIATPWRSSIMGLVESNMKDMCVFLSSSNTNRFPLALTLTIAYVHRYTNSSVSFTSPHLHLLKLMSLFYSITNVQSLAGTFKKNAKNCFTRRPASSSSRHQNQRLQNQTCWRSQRSDSIQSPTDKVLLFQSCTGRCLCPEPTKEVEYSSQHGPQLRNASCLPTTRAGSWKEATSRACCHCQQGQHGQSSLDCISIQQQSRRFLQSIRVRWSVQTM